MTTLIEADLAELRETVAHMSDGDFKAVPFHDAETGIQWAIQSDYGSDCLLDYDCNLAKENAEGLVLLRNRAEDLLAAAGENAKLREAADLYHRGYAAMQAADISEYLALCGDVRRLEKEAASVTYDERALIASRDSLAAENAALRTEIEKERRDFTETVAGLRAEVECSGCGNEGRLEPEDIDGIPVVGLPCPDCIHGKLVAAEQRIADLEAALTNLFRHKPSRFRGPDAPGHCHRIPGIWDNDNGAKSGMPCEWCAAWKAAELLAVKGVTT